MIYVKIKRRDFKDEVFTLTFTTNLDLRFRATFIIGAKNTEFGEKQNDYRIEFRVGYYF